MTRRWTFPYDPAAGRTRFGSTGMSPEEWSSASVTIVDGPTRRRQRHRHTSRSRSTAVAVIKVFFQPTATSRRHCGAHAASRATPDSARGYAAHHPPVQRHDVRSSRSDVARARFASCLERLSIQLLRTPSDRRGSTIRSLRGAPRLINVRSRLSGSMRRGVAIGRERASTRNVICRGSARWYPEYSVAVESSPEGRRAAQRHADQAGLTGPWLQSRTSRIVPTGAGVRPTSCVRTTAGTYMSAEERQPRASPVVSRSRPARPLNPRPPSLDIRSRRPVAVLRASIRGSFVNLIAPASRPDDPPVPGQLAPAR